MKKIIGNVFCVAAAGFLIWMALSFIDVNAHNLGSGKAAGWNMFRLMEVIR